MQDSPDLDVLGLDALNLDLLDPDLNTANLNPPFPEASAPDLRQKFLRFQVCPQNTALLAVEQIAAVVPIGISDILPVPQMPTCVLGLYNWRGEMLWLVDLSCQIGFPSLFAANTALSTLMAIVVQVAGQSLGFVVRQVHDIERHDPEQIQLPISECLPPQLLPFVQGSLSNDQTIVLNGSALLQAPVLQVHSLH
jgi:chemotaxis signal transduction protein